MRRSLAMVLLAGCNAILGIPEPHLPSDTTFTLVVTVTGGTSSARTVKSGDGQIDCGTTCMHAYDGGTTVTLTGTGNGYIPTWGGACASSGKLPSCTVEMSEARTVTVEFVSINYVFVSKDAFDPSMGVTKADMLCQQEANDRGFPDAAFYVAWLSTFNTPARDRIAGARGWVRPDGMPVLDSPAKANEILYPPRLGSIGEDDSQVVVATGTDGNGATAENCLDWSSGAAMQMAATGKPGRGAWGWTQAFTMPCSTPQMRVYCLGTQALTVLTPLPRVGRIAFVSDGAFDPASGRDEADRLCRDEAATNDLPGTYLALVSLINEAAAQRFDTNGAVWVRPDGVQLTERPSNLFEGQGLSAAFDVTGSLTYLDLNQTVWSGSDQPNMKGLYEPQTCNDWHDPLGSGAYGETGLTESFLYFHAASAPCDNLTSRRVYCLQQ